MEVFQNYAKYYDLFYKDKNYKKESEYIDSIISKYSKKKSSIFELGCGTGIHAIELAKKGHKIDGIDFSEKMIRMANDRLKETNLSASLNFKKGDVRKFKNKKKYDCVISLFHIVSYMNTNDDIKKMFDTASHHLKKGGVFVFDCWYGPAVLSQKPEKRTKKAENEDISVIRKANPVMYPNKNLVDVNYRIEITDKKSKKKEVVDETHKMRYLFCPEVDFFLKNSGFKLLKSEQWLTKKEPGFDTWGVCFVAKKSY